MDKQLIANLFFSIFLTVAVTIMAHLLLGYYAFGMNNVLFTLVSTIMVFLDGFLVYDQFFLTIPETFGGVA